MAGKETVEKFIRSLTVCIEYMESKRRAIEITNFDLLTDARDKLKEFKRLTGRTVLILNKILDTSEVLARGPSEEKGKMPSEFLQTSAKETSRLLQGFLVALFGAYDRQKVERVLGDMLNNIKARRAQGSEYKPTYYGESGYLLKLYNRLVKPNFDADTESYVVFETLISLLGLILELEDNLQMYVTIGE